jgi:hypothetical protein
MNTLSNQRGKIAMNTTATKGEIAMKLYLGIRQTASHIHLVALTSQGEAVLKTCIPSACSPQALIDSIKAIQQVFDTSIRISTCLTDDHQQLFLEPIQKEFSSVRSFHPSIFHSTQDLLPDQDPYAPDDPYRYPLLLAILDSLDQ